MAMLEVHCPYAGALKRRLSALSRAKRPRAVLGLHLPVLPPGEKSVAGLIIVQGHEKLHPPNLLHRPNQGKGTQTRLSALSRCALSALKRALKSRLFNGLNLG